jgi:hypothetical protein
MPMPHVYTETKQISFNYQKRQNISRKLKWVQMDFTITTWESVEQVKATEVVIPILHMMTQTTFCWKLTIIEVTQQVKL